MIPRFHAAVVFAVLAATGTFVASAAVTPPSVADGRSVAPVTIDSCTVITEPGTYVLDADVASETYRCIDVRASDVALDGRGHAITATGKLKERGRHLVTETPGQFGVGVAAGSRGAVSNVTVSNLTVTGFDAGVHVRDADDATVRNVTATANVDGIDVEESTNVTVAGVDASSSVEDGVGVENATGVQVTGTNASGNGYAGVAVVDSTWSRVTDTTTDDNEGDGVLLRNASGIGVHGVAASNNTVGVLLLDATRSSVTASTVEGSAFAGVALAGADDNVVAETNVTNTTGTRRLLPEPSGLWLHDASGNRIVGVAAADNRNWTVYARNGSAGNVVEGLRIDGVVTVSVTGRDVALAATQTACPLPASASVHEYLRVVGTSDDAHWNVSGSVDSADCTVTEARA